MTLGISLKNKETKLCLIRTTFWLCKNLHFSDFSILCLQTTCLLISMLLSLYLIVLFCIQLYNTLFVYSINIYVYFPLSLFILPSCMLDFHLESLFSYLKGILFYLKGKHVDANSASVFHQFWKFNFYFFEYCLSPIHSLLSS